jgi:hypothetical protein
MNALGGNYIYSFKRYALYSDSATTSRIIYYIMAVNSKCVNNLLATFRPANYNAIANSVNTFIAALLSAGHTEAYPTTIDNHIAALLQYALKF